jgi:hypothetical protein
MGRVLNFLEMTWRVCLWVEHARLRGYGRELALGGEEMCICDFLSMEREAEVRLALHT